MEGGSLADLAAMMGLSSVNITDSMNKDRERRPSNRSDSSDASSVAVSDVVFSAPPPLPFERHLL